MSNELIIKSPTNTHFKSKILVDCTNRISQAGALIDNTRREIAIQLHRVAGLPADVLEADGFRGVGDYAQKVFGIAPSTTSNLIKVASKIYLNKNPEIAKLAETMPTANLCEIAQMETGELIKSVADGKIAPDKSQKQLREIVKASKRSSIPARVLPMYDYRLSVRGDNWDIKGDQEMALSYLREKTGAFEKTNGATRVYGNAVEGISVAVCPDTEEVAILRYTRVNHNTRKNGDVKKYTIDEIAKMLGKPVSEIKGVIDITPTKSAR